MPLLLRLALLWCLFSAAGLQAEPVRGGFDFPDQLGPYARVRIDDFEQRQAGLGTGISYRTPGVTVSVYVYTLGQNGLEDGIASPAAQAQFRSAQNDIRQSYADTQTLQPGETLDIGGLPWLHSEHRFTARFADGSAPAGSHLFLSIVRGHFIKLRITHGLQGAAERGSRLREELLLPLSAVLKPAR